ncbi:MAG: hypothetical protein JWO50_380 [Candidatus Kaiserbacteria bacterium]|nr:hypothetical protein [Candidatus Kaiserbacteria bacterium]
MRGDIWPDLIVFAPLAVALLRAAAGIAFIYIAYTMSERDTAFTKVAFPLIGKPDRSLVWLSAFITAVVGFALFVGFLTQIMALLGLCIAIKHLFFANRYPYLFPLSRSSYALLIIITIALFICGTGTLAFDLMF